MDVTAGRTPARLGLTPDELIVHTWGADRAPRYAGCLPGLNVLAGETLALVGDGTAALLDRLADVLPACARLDGAVAAAGGTLRIQAVQAARVGVRSLAISDPLPTRADASTRALAVADLAGLANLGLTTVVAVPDAPLAALVADRVVVVAGGYPEVAYPVVSPVPRSPAEVAPVTARVTARLAAAG